MNKKDNFFSVLSGTVHGCFGKFTALAVPRGLFAAAAVAGLVLASASCGDFEGGRKALESLAPLTVEVGDPVTKVYTDPIGGDLTPNNLQVLLYDASGNYFDKLALSQSGGVYSGHKDVPVGTYTVAAVANGVTYAGSDAVSATYSAVKGKYGSLASNGDDFVENPASGMARAGFQEAVSVAASGATVSMTASLLAYRATVNTITVSGNAAGRLTITGAFLENIYGRTTLSGTSSELKNPGGRTGFGTGSATKAVVTSSTSYGGSLTYYAGNPAGRTHAFYAYVNTGTAESFDGPLASGASAHERLVLVGTWKDTSDSAGETVYYPITIQEDNAGAWAPVRSGYSYDISATITKKGSDDPNKPVPDGGGMTVTVTVQPWTAGPEFTGYKQ